MFKEDRERLVAYNLNDARLVLEILDKLDLVALAVERSRLTGMPPDRVSASIASFDFLYLSALVAPAHCGARPWTPQSTPVRRPAADTSWNLCRGFIRNVLVFDFRSLYPSIIRTFQIDPLGHLRSPQPGNNPIVAPNGAAFRREHGILPGNPG